VSIIESLVKMFFIAALSIPVLLIWFELIFKLAKQKKVRWLAKLMVPLFIISDAAANIYSITILYQELPREWLVTDRLKRWKRIPDRNDRRSKFAWRMCKRLNRSDPGHC